MKTININVKEVREIFNDFTWSYIDSLEFDNINYLIFNSIGGGINNTFEIGLKNRDDYYDEMTENEIRKEVLENLRELHDNLMDSEEYEEYEKEPFYDNLAQILLEVDDEEIINRVLKRNGVNELILNNWEYQIQYPNQYQKDLIYCYSLELSFGFMNETFEMCYSDMSFSNCKFSDEFELGYILHELAKEDEEDYIETINGLSFIKDNFEKFQTIYNEIDKEITDKLEEALYNLRSEYGI